MCQFSFLATTTVPVHTADYSWIFLLLAISPFLIILIYVSRSLFVAIYEDYGFKFVVSIIGGVIGICAWVAFFMWMSIKTL